MISNRECIERMKEELAAPCPTELTNRERIERMLDELAAGLAPFVDSEMRNNRGENWPDEFDTRSATDGHRALPRLPNLRVDFRDPWVVLILLKRNFKKVFGKTLDRECQGWVNELYNARNRSSHREGTFELSTTYDLLDSASRLLAAAEAAWHNDVNRDPHTKVGAEEAAVELGKAWGGQATHSPTGRQRTVVSSPPDSAVAAEHFARGADAARGNDFDAAKLAFQAALEVDPDHVAANIRLGLLLHKEGRFAEARSRFERVLASRPDHAPAHYCLGLAWQNEGNPANAAQAFLRAAQEGASEESDRTPWYIYKLARALLASGQRDRALRRFREARDEAELYSQPELVARIDEALRRIGAAGR